MLASPPRSQWRGRAGFSPASLLSLEQKHQKQTAYSDYALGRVDVKCGTRLVKAHCALRFSITASCWKRERGPELGTG